jgi:hypothetical protein
VGRHGLDLAQEQMEGASECGKRPSGPIKWAEFADQQQMLGSQEEFCST